MPDLPETRMATQMAPSTVTVREIMSPGILTISSLATVGMCAAAMHDRRTHAVLVVDDSTREPRGWVFHKDILGHLREDPLTTVAGSVVSQEAAYIEPGALAEDAAERMDNEGLTHLLVGSSNAAVPEGVLSSWDLVSFYARVVGRTT